MVSVTGDKGQEIALSQVALVDDKGKVIYNEYVAQSKPVVGADKKSGLEGGLSIFHWRSIQYRTEIYPFSEIVCRSA